MPDNDRNTSDKPDADQGPDVNLGGVDRLGFPLVLLVALWAMASPFLTSLDMQNKIRDRVVEAGDTAKKEKYSYDERTHFYEDDWLPVFWGTAIFLGILTFAVGVCNYHVAPRKPKPLFLASWIVIMLPLAAFWGLLWGGLQDQRWMQHELGRAAPAKPALQNQPKP